LQEDHFTVQAFKTLRYVTTWGQY